MEAGLTLPSFPSPLVEEGWEKGRGGREKTPGPSPNGFTNGDFDRNFWNNSFQLSRLPIIQQCETIMTFPGLEQIPAGEVRLFPGADLDGFHSPDGSLPGGEPISFKIVTVLWPRVPPIERILEDALHKLAEVSLALWPHWYTEDGRPLFPSQSDLGSFLENPGPLLPFDRSRQEISLHWLKAAARLCQAGRLPLPDQFPDAVQASQLALTIGRHRLCIILGTEEEHPAPARLMGLTRSAEWLAGRTGASLAVLIPAPLADHPELEPILYQAALPVPRRVASPAVHEPDEAIHVVWPVIGIPHPFSPGEQKLAQWLRRDPELADLFEFNQPVDTARSNRWLVDLLWRAGKLVVEVDSYRHHSHREAFIRDRRRDYELTISGYTVLRITHDEVIHDIHLAMDKIRDVVRFRRRSLRENNA